MMSTRREFVAGTVAAGSALLLEKPLSGAAMTATVPQLFVVDYEIADARRVAEAAASKGCRTVPISGDRVRFAREVFTAGAAEIVGGITTYADFLVLTGCAAEAGYRVLSERAAGALIRWKVARLSCSICS
jgi:hypothetical protein